MAVLFGLVPDLHSAGQKGCAVNEDLVKILVAVARAWYETARALMAHINHLKAASGKAK